MGASSYRANTAPTYTDWLLYLRTVFYMLCIYMRFCKEYLQVFRRLASISCDSNSVSTYIGGNEEETLYSIFQ